MNIFLFLSLLVLPASARADQRFTAEQLAAKDYRDLGPKEIDVSAYPEEQQKNYRIFVKACSSCHTLARAVNSPLVSREDWRRSVKRMHARSKSNAAAAIGVPEAKAAIEFLTYDAKIRKVKDAAGFKAKTAELKALYEEIQNERARIRPEGP
ncbi:MAG: hypothetical protein HY923_10425 [Elusimicrobia bacterium]|nr:hypothetical protein [Elusimicrobiota bacterium]